MPEETEIMGYYYLHQNGELIFKRLQDDLVADFHESDFVRAFWPIGGSIRREDAWTLLVEALAAGALPARVLQLADRWGCNDTDAKVYAGRVGVTLAMDGPSCWQATAPGHVNLQESPSGFGDTCLEAMAQLCKELGYQPTKMWGATFASLLDLQKAGVKHG